MSADPAPVHSDDIEPVVTDEAADQAPAKPRGKFFRRSNATRMAPDAAARQGRVTTLALAAFKDRDAVMHFLNTHDPDLGGRPLDLAIAGASGLAAVEAMIVARQASATQPSESGKTSGRGGAN